MVAGIETGVSGGFPKDGGPAWRRLAGAGALSLLIHLALVLWSRPEYRPVADFAVELEVVEGLPGRPDSASEEDLVDPEPRDPPPEPPIPATPPPVADTERGPVTAVAAEVEVVDAGTGDEDPGETLAAEAAVGDDGGICLHDLFGFGEDRPSWLMWLSMASFRGTIYQKSLADALGSFVMYREMAGATGMDPGTEVEGLLVTATDPFDWNSYRVVASYDSGEERLKSRLTARRHRADGFFMRRTDDGYRAEVPGEYRWQLVGSGRVLIVESAPGAPVESGPFRAVPAPAAPPPPPLPFENPYEEPGTDAGPAPPDPDAGPRAKPPPPLPHDGRRWPAQVTCLVRSDSGPLFEPRPCLSELGRSHLGPDGKGHWPVTLLATSDARALGLDFPRGSGLSFRWALLKGFFSDPVRVEGYVFVEADRARLEDIAHRWSGMARQAGGDPWLSMFGLGGIFDNLVIEVAENRIEFTLPLTPGQVRAALLFIQLQGEAIERRIRRGHGKGRTIPPISLATPPDTRV